MWTKETQRGGGGGGRKRGRKLSSFPFFPVKEKKKGGGREKPFLQQPSSFSFQFCVLYFFAFKEGGKVKGERKDKRRRQTRRVKQMEILIVPAKLFQFFCGQTMPANFDCS